MSGSDAGATANHAAKPQEGDAAGPENDLLSALTGGPSRTLPGQEPRSRNLLHKVQNAEGMSPTNDVVLLGPKMQYLAVGGKGESHSLSLSKEWPGPYWGS